MRGGPVTTFQHLCYALYLPWRWVAAAAAGMNILSTGTFPRNTNYTLPPLGGVCVCVLCVSVRV